MSTCPNFLRDLPEDRAGRPGALLAMGKSTEESGLDKTIVELAKLRVSQINNCAFCLQIHLNVSRRLGLPQEKLDLVATWHEAGIFSDKECAALAWAETADAARRCAACRTRPTKACAGTSARTR